jgi:hypothetical protein
MLSQLLHRPACAQGHEHTEAAAQRGQGGAVELRQPQQPHERQPVRQPPLHTGSGAR